MTPSIASRPSLPALSKSDADIKRYLETTNPTHTPTQDRALYQASSAHSFTPQLHPHSFADAMVVDDVRPADQQSTPYPLYSLHPTHIASSMSGKTSNILNVEAADHLALNARQPGQFDGGDTNLAKAAAQSVKSNWLNLSQAPAMIYNNTSTPLHAVPTINNQGIYNEQATLPSASQSLNYHTYHYDTYAKPLYKEAHSGGSSTFDQSSLHAVGGGQGQAMSTRPVPFPMYEASSQATYGYMDAPSSQATASNDINVEHRVGTQLSISNHLPSPPSIPQVLAANVDVSSAETPSASTLSHESSISAPAISAISGSPTGPLELTPSKARSPFAIDHVGHKDLEPMTDVGPFLFGSTDPMSTHDYDMGTLDQPSDSLPYSYPNDFGIGEEFPTLAYDYSQEFENAPFIEEVKEVSMATESQVAFSQSDFSAETASAAADSPRRGRGHGRGRSSRARGRTTTAPGTALSSCNDEPSDKGCLGTGKKRFQNDVTVPSNPSDTVSSSDLDDHYYTSDRDSKRLRTQSDEHRSSPYRLRTSSLAASAKRNAQSISPLRQSLQTNFVEEPLSRGAADRGGNGDDDTDELDAREGGDEAGEDSEYEEADDESELEGGEDYENDDDDEYVQGRSSGRPRGRASSGRKGRKGRGKSHLSAAWALQAVQAESDDPVLHVQPPGYANDMQADVPSMFSRNGKGRRKRTSSIPLPIPVPNLTKKSRGRKVPAAPLEADGQVYNEDVIGESSSSGYVGSGEGGSLSDKRASRGRRVPTTADGPGIEDRPFICEVDGCSKRFVRGEHLKRHVRSIHTHDKPFICPYKGCGKTFSRRDNLGQHARVHVS